MSEWRVHGDNENRLGKTTCKVLVREKLETLYTTRTQLMVHGKCIPRASSGVNKFHGRLPNLVLYGHTHWAATVPIDVTARLWMRPCSSGR